MTKKNTAGTQLKKANLWRKLPAPVEQMAAESCSCVAPKQLAGKGAGKGMGGKAAGKLTGDRSRHDECLFGDMRPGKLLAIISACRAAGVTHIIEEGRYGGLSALVYAMHGFKVRHRLAAGGSAPDGTLYWPSSRACAGLRLIGSSVRSRR